MRKTFTIAMAMIVIAAAVHAATMQTANGPASGHAGWAMMGMASASADMDCHQDGSDCCAEVDCSMLCAALACSLVRRVDTVFWRLDTPRVVSAPVQALMHLSIPPPAPPPKTSA